MRVLERIEKIGGDKI